MSNITEKQGREHAAVGVGARQREQHPNLVLPFPVSFFQSVFDTAHNGMNRIATWGEFGATLEYASTVALDGKDSNILFAPTVFNGTRCKNNATDCGALVHDTDGGLNIERVIKLLERSRLESFCYTSARNIAGERFRLVVPLLHLVDVNTQMKAVRALRDFICDELDLTVGRGEGQWDLDRGKLNPYQLFYLPGQYKSAGMNLFHYTPGDVVQAESWLELYPQADRVEPDPHAYEFPDDDDDMTRARVKAALAVVSPDLGHDDGWLDIGMALHSQFGDSEGLALWDSWSSGSRKYDAAVIRSKWRSFHPGGGTTIATLFKRADDADPSWRDQFKPKLPGADLPGQTIAEMLAEYEQDQREQSERSRMNGSSPHPEYKNEEPEPEGPREPLPGAPIDVFGSLTPDPVLRPDMLPERLERFVFDTAERLGSDPALVMCAALGAAAAALDDAIKVQVKERDPTWLERACLWFILLGPSGTSKTPSIDAAKAPVKRVQEQWMLEDAKKLADYDRKMEIYENEYKAWQAKFNKGEDGGLPPDEPTKPPRRQIIVNDMTMETLAQEISAENPRGVWLLYDELAGLIGSMDAYKNGKKDRPLLLQLWNGGSHSINRQGKRIHVENYSASVLGGIQEDKLEKMAETMSDDGLLQRFLVCRVGNQGRNLDRLPDLDAISDYHCMIEAISKVEAEVRERNSFHEPPHEPIILSAGAHRYRREVEDVAYAIRDLPMFPPALRDHANKMNGLFARLLLTIHTIECSPKFKPDEFAVISEETARRTRNLMVLFFIPSAINVYRDYLGGSDERNSDVQWIAGHILAHGYEKITERDIYRAEKKFERNRARLQRAMDTLFYCNWVEPVPARRVVDKPNTWIVTPLVHTSFPDIAQRERDRRNATRAKLKGSNTVLKNAFTP